MDVTTLTIKYLCHMFVQHRLFKMRSWVMKVHEFRLRRSRITLILCLMIVASCAWKYDVGFHQDARKSLAWGIMNFYMDPIGVLRTRHWKGTTTLRLAAYWRHDFRCSGARNKLNETPSVSLIWLPSPNLIAVDCQFSHCRLHTDWDLCQWPDQNHNNFRING
jgi:hypothetical protein